MFQALANAVKLQRCLGPPPLRQITLGVIHSRSQYCPRQLRNRNRGISRVSLSTRACLDVQLLGEFLVRNNASWSDLSFPIIAYPAVLSYRGGVRKPLHPSGMERSSRNVSPPEITRPPKYSRRLSPPPSPPLNRDMDIWHGSSRFEREFIMRVCAVSTAPAVNYSRMERWWNALSSFGRNYVVDRVGVRFAYRWPRLKRFEINAVLNIMAQVWLVYIVRYRRGEECDLLGDLGIENWDRVVIMVLVDVWSDVWRGEG